VKRKHIELLKRAGACKQGIARAKSGKVTVLDLDWLACKVHRDWLCGRWLFIEMLTIAQAPAALFFTEKLIRVLRGGWFDGEWMYWENTVDVKPLLPYIELLEGVCSNS
jgi:hypothetical protein